MATATLTGIAKSTGHCADCLRELSAAVYTVRDNATGAERDLGRVCATKATGWARPDREATRIARLAVVAERRAALLAVGMPEAHAATAASADAWWVGRTPAQIAAAY